MRRTVGAGLALAVVLATSSGWGSGSSQSTATSHPATAISPAPTVAPSSSVTSGGSEASCAAAFKGSKSHPVQQSGEWLLPRRSVPGAAAGGRAATSAGRVAPTEIAP